MKRKGIIFVVSAPSGAGKSTLSGHVVARIPDLKYSISCTTRAPRPGEKNGVHYFFVTKGRFSGMVKKGEFLEWAKVHGHMYGTPKSYISKCVKNGKDIILDIDVQGGLNVRKIYPDSVMIFVMTPNFAVLEKRLKERKKDSRETIKKRLENAKKEITYIPKYDYLIINDKLDVAISELKEIILGERRKTKRAKIPRFK
ncbi:MAG: guanylate kinase [Endomicrobiales bacterium]|nr:guanylate kinase [Endomicrobiales bacterium]